jgi:predicted DNA-binding ribbon-helix-helix protein
MKSIIIKRSVLVRGHKTSVSLEEPFWNGLKEIASSRELPLTAVLQQIDLDRGDNANLSSAVRLFVLEYYRDRAGADTMAHDVHEPRTATSNGVGDMAAPG